MKVYDKTGTERTLAWLKQHFGQVEAVAEDGVEFVCTELHEVDDLYDSAMHICAPSSLQITVVDEDGNPVVGQKVVWWWPGATEFPLPGAGHHECGHVGTTDPDGRVDFPMGKGAFYKPASEKGPHTVWLYGPGKSGRVEGLGMVFGSNHRHLDVKFGPKGEAPGNDELLKLIRQHAEDIIVAVDEILGGA